MLHSPLTTSTWTVAELSMRCAARWKGLIWLVLLINPAPVFAQEPVKKAPVVFTTQQDHQVSFVAAIAAQPVFRSLDAKDLGRSDDYKSEKMPAVNVNLLDGELAWRQHDGGYTDEPNVEHFIKWANRHYGRPAVDLSFAP